MATFECGDGKSQWEWRGQCWYNRQSSKADATSRSQLGRVTRIDTGMSRDYSSLFVWVNWVRPGDRSSNNLVNIPGQEPCRPRKDYFYFTNFGTVRVVGEYGWVINSNACSLLSQSCKMWILFCCTSKTKVSWSWSEHDLWKWPGWIVPWRCKESLLFDFLASKCMENTFGDLDWLEMRSKEADTCF